MRVKANCGLTSPLNVFARNCDRKSVFGICIISVYPAFNNKIDRGETRFFLFIFLLCFYKKTPTVYSSEYIWANRKK